MSVPRSTKVLLLLPDKVSPAPLSALKVAPVKVKVSASGSKAGTTHDMGTKAAGVTGARLRLALLEAVPLV